MVQNKNNIKEGLSSGRRGGLAENKQNIDLSNRGNLSDDDLMESSRKSGKVPQGRKGGQIRNGKK